MTNPPHFNPYHEMIALDWKDYMLVTAAVVFVGVVASAAIYFIVGGP